MSKVSKRPAVRMPTAAEDKAITAAAKGDPDAQPLTPSQLKAMVPLRALRGRPKSENKKLRVSALQPRGCCLLQVHRGRLAIAHGWRASSVRGAPFPQRLAGRTRRSGARGAMKPRSAGRLHD